MLHQGRRVVRPPGPSDYSGPPGTFEITAPPLVWRATAPLCGCEAPPGGVLQIDHFWDIFSMTSRDYYVATSALEHHTARSTSSIWARRMTLERWIASYKRIVHEMRADAKAVQNVSKIAPIMHWRRRMCRARLCLCWWQTKGAEWPPSRCLSRCANGVQQSVRAGAGEGLQHRS